jgi:hypothetical protein
LFNGGLFLFNVTWQWIRQEAHLNCVDGRW